LSTQTRQRLSKLERDERWLGFALLLPAALLLGLMVVYPVANLIWTSLHTVKLSEPWLGQPFVGLANYERAWSEPGFWHATGNTLLLIVITVPGSLAVGLGLALLANKIVHAKWLVRLGLLMPWMLPLVFVGLVFQWFFDTKLGIVNDVTARIGITPRPWLTSPFLAQAAICIAIVWKSSSFVAMVLLAGLQSIPRSLYEAAEIDGASVRQQFVSITLPMLRPAIVVALIFRTITAVQTFDIPYAMTGGGPGNATETLAMYIQKTTIDFLDFGYGSALATLMFVVSMVATAFYIRFVHRDSLDG
jgi:multiple sugar transport system permease protein